MAQYYYDFSQQPLSSTPPSGWIEVGDSGKVSIVDYAVGGRAMQVIAGPNTENFDAACIWNDLGAISRPLEIVVKWLQSEEVNPRGGVLACGDTTQWNGYIGQLRTLSNQQDLIFHRLDAGARATLGDTNNGIVFANTLHWTRFQFLTDGTINVRIWKDGDPEPSTWTQTFVDGIYSTGHIGVEIQRYGTYYYFWIGVGTDGDPAPTSSQPASIDASASLALSSPTTSGHTDDLRNTSASLLLTSPKTSGQADEIRDTSASLLLVSPQVAGQANELRDTSVAIQFDSPKVTGITGGFVTADAALQFSAPVVSASSVEIHDISAALTLASLQTAGQAEAIEAVSASLRLASPAIAGNLGGQIASVALQLSAVQVSGRSQMYPIAGGQIATGALSLAATVDSADIAAGRAKVGVLGLTASVTKPSSAQGSVKTGNLAFGAQIYHVAEVTEGGLQVGALSLSCSLTSLNRLASADVVVTDAVFAGVSVDDALHVHAVFAD